MTLSFAKLYFVKWMCEVGCWRWDYIYDSGQSLESFLQIPIYIIYEISQNDVNKKIKNIIVK